MDKLDYQKINIYNKFVRRCGYVTMLDPLRCSNADFKKDMKVSLKEHGDDIRAIMVCFSDIEGRLHVLDYDKDFLLENEANLTFDGSSIRGFTGQDESDLRLVVDWSSFYYLPPDLFGPGKALVFSFVKNPDGTPYESDMRSVLAEYLKEGSEVNIAAEIEGFLFEGLDVEKTYNETREFVPVTAGGYFNTLPKSKLRQFVDKCAIFQRQLGFENEKDHPEVAPSQFEMNWKYTDALIAADQIQLYKLVCRQVASDMGCTACFLPKPLAGVNGNGMHINISLARYGKNVFAGKNGELSQEGDDFVTGLMANGEALCLIMNSSVNAYRRLNPEYEAPNRIMFSRNDRGAMIRIPTANEQSARIEVRTVAPDANPYMLIYALVSAGQANTDGWEGGGQLLPKCIDDAIDIFKNSSFIDDILSMETKIKYLGWKLDVAERCARALGNNVKAGEVMFHHEVTNQHLWQMF